MKRDAATFPDDANGAVLRRMREHGDDLSRPRALDFTVVLPDRAAAQAFGDQFHRLGHRVSARHEGTLPQLPWEVVVVKFMRPTHEAITRFEHELGVVAARLGGRNDGWGCREA